MKNKKNLILVDYDCPEEWKFKKGLFDSTDEQWEVKKLISNVNHSGKMQNIIRYLKYFVFPLYIFINRNRYKRVIGWQQFFGLILAFYCRLFRVKDAPDIYVMTFIYNKKCSRLGRIYERFVKYCISSEAIKKIIVFSDTEPAYYSTIFNVDESLFVTIQLGIEDIIHKYDISDNKRFLSAGRSNRDYDFLLNNWTDKLELDIVSDILKKSESEKIKIYNSIHGESFYKMLAKCHAVIISLKDENISSGQLVILEAMMLKKPIICTKNKAVENYIDTGINGVIIDKDIMSLEKAIQYIEEHYIELTENARSKYESKYTEYQMGLNIGKLIKGD